MKNSPNVLFVCAAGNSNLNLDENNLYPVSYKLNNVISVMSINNEGTIYEYSGYGLKEQDIAWTLVLRPSQKFMDNIEDIKSFLAGYNQLGTYTIKN